MRATRPPTETFLRYEWAATIRRNLERLFGSHSTACVGGGHPVSAVVGDPTAVQTPDAYVAFGRPPAPRDSYRVWEEAGIFPQVVFHILPADATASEWMKRRDFYNRHGVEELIAYSPDDRFLDIHVREGGVLTPLDEEDGWTSPRLGVRIALRGDKLALVGPDGKPFLTFDEVCEDPAEAATRVALAEAWAGRMEASEVAAERRAATARRRAATARYKVRQAQALVDRLKTRDELLSRPTIVVSDN